MEAWSVCKWIDAFQQQWNDRLIYAFPPFSVIPRVLQHIMHKDGLAEDAELMMIVPRWTTQTWWIPLLRLIIADPLILPRNAIYMPQHPEMTPKISVSLVCMLISSSHSKRKEYQAGLQKFVTPHGRMTPQTSLGLTLSGGMTFVVNEKLVHFRHL